MATSLSDTTKKMKRMVSGSTNSKTEPNMKELSKTMKELGLECILMRMESPSKENGGLIKLRESASNTTLIKHTLWENGKKTKRMAMDICITQPSKKRESSCGITVN